MCSRAFLVIAAFCCVPAYPVAQEAPQPPADQSRPAHGIIRKPQPKPAQPATQTEQPVKPVASTEAVAAAIASAVRSVEEAKKPSPAPARPAHAAVPRAVARRYSVQWPDSRVQLHWEGAADERVTLAWSSSD
jgi:hypothetical protein